MGTKNKRTLAEGAIPTTFCYSQPTKKCKKSEKRQEKKQNSELIASTSNDNESDLHLQQETSNEFCHESSTDTNPVTVPSYASKKDCSVQTNNTKIKLKSVKTEYSEPILCDDCKKKRESTAGSVSDSAPSCDSDTENDFFEPDIMKRDDFNDINELEFIVFWSCLLSLFGFCFTCLSKNFIEKVSVRGTLLYVKTIWKNNHVFEWKSQPKLKNISIGNILLFSSILYSGNTFGQIYEMFKIINTA